MPSTVNAWSAKIYDRSNALHGLGLESLAFVAAHTATDNLRFIYSLSLHFRPREDYFKIPNAA